MLNVTGLFQGFVTLFHFSTFIYLIIGFLTGTFFGAIPGLTATLAIALLLPITYSLDVISALVMCMGIFMAGIYSGSITATTINIPGAPSAMMTAIEGHPLMQKGQGAKALGHAAFGSMIGGTIGSILLMLIAPISAKIALLVKTPGKFSLILFALVAVILAQRGAIIKAIIATLFGIMLSTIGMDTMLPVARFTFGFEDMVSGIDFISVVIGVFAIGELLIQSIGSQDFIVSKKDIVGAKKIKIKDFVPRLEEIKEIGLFTYLKSALIGFFIGVLPGAGGSMAAFMSYTEAMRSSKHPEKYGKGSLEGIAAAETANNAMCGGALVPMLTFGIPGDGVTAVILGVLMIQGLIPGPHLMTTQFHLIAPMLVALLISAILLIPLSLMLFGKYYITIVSINRAILYSTIALIALVGSYASTYSIFQMGATVILGVIAFIFRTQKYPTVSLLLGFILGPMLEKYFRRSLMLSSGNPMIFITNPDSLVFLGLILIFILYFLKRKESFQ